jgi:hypothetical protein
MASSQNFFVLIQQGLNLPAGSHTPQNKILRGIGPRRTRSCRVSDPAEQSLVGYQTQHNNGRVVYILKQTLVLQGLILSRTMSCGVDTLPNKVLQGIRHRGTKSCGVSNLGEQLLNTNISSNSKQNSKLF